MSLLILGWPTQSSGCMEAASNVSQQTGWYSALRVHEVRLVYAYAERMSRIDGKYHR